MFSIKQKKGDKKPIDKRSVEISVMKPVVLTPGTDLWATCGIPIYSKSFANKAFFDSNCLQTFYSFESPFYHSIP